MRRNRHISDRKDNGVIITLVAVFMLGVVGAMAALSIDVVTLYTARSEAQLAADAAALAGARVLANSGATSDSTGILLASAWPLAQNVAVEVARHNDIGGSPVTASEIPAPVLGGTTTNPTVTVHIRKADLPTFFARIWGRTQIAVAASATAEAYNPSGTGLGGAIPVAPICVKPWLLPNIDPSNSPNTILNPMTGQVTSPATLLGWSNTGNRLRADCTSCTVGSAPTQWRYYPGTTDATTGDFPAPNASSCTGCAAFSANQLSVAGCVQKPISCNQTVNIDTTNNPTLDADTADAVDALTHSGGNGGDSVDLNPAPPPGGNAPFQFQAGTENPAVLSGALAAQADIMVSDSLVTVPVIDATSTLPPSFPQVQIIGFVQLFLNPTGAPVPGSNHIHTQVMNIVGCGTSATGNPIIGNGASPVAVRLISP